MKIYTKKYTKKTGDPFVVQRGRVTNEKLAAGYRLQWTEEGMLGEREAETAGDKVGRNISMIKINWLIFFVVAGFLILFIKTAYLQIIQHEYYQQLAQYNRIREERLSADRGVIYDASGKALVYNTPVFYLQVIPADILNALKTNQEITSEQISGSIGNILGKEIEEEFDYFLIKNKSNNIESYQPQILADNIEYNQALKLMLLVENLPGISVEIRPQRTYDLVSPSFSHILGYTGIITEDEFNNLKEKYFLTDYLGKIGIEKTWEKELRGVNGKKYIEADALGKEIRVISQKEAQDGNNLLLSIDENLQGKLEEEMMKQLDLSGEKRASAIVMDPNNGSIKALVSIPAFDNNIFARGISVEEYKELINNKNQPLFNRAISGEFPTGSTFKPVVAAAALQEGIINKNTKFNSTGGIAVKSWFFPDWQAGGHGITDVRKAIAWSVNTFFYYIGGGYPAETGLRDEFIGLGVKRITDYARLFGLGQTLGIDLPNEASGFLPSKNWKEEVKGEAWYIGDTYHLAIGQGDISATPLQVAAYTSVFANGGTFYQPQIVDALVDNNKKIIQDIEPVVLRHDFIDQDNIQIVRLGMYDTVDYGSAKSMQSVPVPVAGKTGTAQWSTTKNPHSWFTGFAPFDNPEIVITVLVEEGASDITDAAIPIARKFLEWYFANEEVINKK